VVCERRLESLKKRAAKAEDADARKSIAAEIEAELRLMPEAVIAPRLFTSNITVERLQQLLTEHDERFAILSDEGGVFTIMAGAYSGGHASIDEFLQGHCGSPLRVDRGSRTAHVDRPALSFGLMLQPGILGETGKNKRFRDSGLMARFLFAVPPSNVGERDIRQHMAIPDRVRTAYQENLRKLLDDRQADQQPGILTFEPEALEVWTVFAETIERRQGDGRELEHITEWTSKLPGAVARIAGLLHLAMHGGANTVIQRAEVAIAVQLGELLIAHAVAAFALMGVSKAEEDAEAIIRWLKAERRDGFLLRDVQRSLRARFPRKDKVEEAIRLLEDWNVIIGRREQRAGPKGGRPSVAYRVHPQLHR
jgi:putative DNA primase/helicase